MRTPLVLRVSLAFAAAFALGAPRARADDAIDLVDALEDTALTQESRAQFEEALATFRKAFAQAVTQAKDAGSEAVRDRNRAVAEALLEKIESTTEAVTKHGETERFLEGVDREAAGPVLGGGVDWLRGRLRLALDDLDGARKLADGLGILRRWWVVGPFDNERGRGFGVTFGPEKGIDLGATYKGKDRAVAWRPVPVDAPLGDVNLDAILRPSDQALAYAVAFVRSPVAVAGAIRLGSDEAVKAWWNGREVLSRDVRRPMAFDQDVAGVAVEAGWNVLLLKVCDQTGAWGFRVRLTAADGTPLAGLSTAGTDEEAKAALAAAPKATPFKGTLAMGARRFFEEAAKRETGRGARDLFHLGLLHARRHYDAVSDRAAEHVLKRAVDRDPRNALLWAHYAEAAAPPAEMSVEVEENRQRAGREKTVELDPQNAVAWRALASYYATAVQQPERAEAAIRRALEIAPRWAEARLELADILATRGLKAQAEVERKRVVDDLAAAAGSVSVASARAQALSGRGLAGDARDAWLAVARLDARSTGAVRAAADLAAAAGDRTAALALLDRVIRAAPYDTEALARKAQLDEGVDAWAPAEETLRKALAIAPEDEGLWQALGRVRWKADRREEAIAAFREALRINPRLQGLERYLEILDPSAAPFEDEYRVEVGPLAERSKDRPNEENDGWLTVLDHTVTRVNVNGTYSTYAHVAARILTKAGSRAWQRYSPPLRGEALRWKVARVVKADGTVVEASRRGGSAEFPPLEPGDLVDVEWRGDQREQTFFGDYFGTVEYLADQVPLVFGRYTLITPVERAFYTHTRNLDVAAQESTTADGRWKVRTWTREDAPKVRREPGMPDALEIYPQVQVSTFQDWDAFAAWWWNLIRDQHILTDEMRAKVAELTAGKESRADKIRAIYDFVTSEITYQAWSFGVHGYKPYTSTAIFEKREGDCKDKAILFDTMLREIGVEAHPVLIRADNARSAEDLTLPLVNHFNHCISHVPDFDGKGTSLWLDGTAQYHSAFLPPVMDRGARVLVVRPDGATVMTIPEGGPDDFGLDQAWQIEVDADGTATAKAEFTWRGDMAVQARQAFSVEGQRPLLLQQFLAGSMSGAKLVSHEFDDLKDLASPNTRFRISVRVPGFARADGQALTLPTKLFDMFEGGLTRLVARPEREYDLLMKPFSARTSAVYRLAPGLQVETAPSDAAIVTKDLAYTSKATVDGATLTLERELRILTSRVTKDAYAGFREAVTKASTASAQTWKLRRTGEAASPGTPPR